MLYMPRSRPQTGPRWALTRRICTSVLAVAMLLALLVQAGFAAFDIKRVEPSVYKIYTMRKKGMGTGTGFLVNGRRTLVTNFHVVAEGEKYFVGYRDGSEGRLVEARVVERRAGVDCRPFLRCPS
jgi:S1-C subfamily serine protease